MNIIHIAYEYILITIVYIYMNIFYVKSYFSYAKNLRQIITILYTSVVLFNKIFIEQLLFVKNIVRQNI